jgi:hypothetical protein
MTDDEIELLQRELAGARRYLEYGSGESTKRAARAPGIERILSIESDRDFIRERVMSDDAVAAAAAEGRLAFPAIDIGPTGKWGRPTDPASRSRWGNYSGAIFATDAPWDLVLVDGVFRVACVAAALLHSPRARVLVHDFWRRPRYRPVLDFCDEIETANQLVLLRRRDGVSDAELTTVLRRHEVMPTDQTPWMHFKARLGLKS